ncbi:cytochrome P450 [Pluteus cervinus]|uniref:Cytochrome P450 n=1 Tax=Pluteus cervinus TaxID=181527 RepID=A0ACD3A3N4_9AGAR|nr:cytochrome P450 [Pluteus cervinus]
MFTLFAGVIAFVLIYAYLIYANRTPPPSLAFLRGPVGGSIFLGFTEVMRSISIADYTEKWMNDYGSVYQIPMAAGTREVIVLDPKAIAYILAKDTVAYKRTPVLKKLVETLIGKGIVWSDGDAHKRQRKAMNPAFSNARVRESTPVFFDVAFKVKSIWDSILDASQSGEGIIEVQEFMNHLAVDNMGLAAFGHAFDCVSNVSSPETQPKPPMKRGPVDATNAAVHEAVAAFKAKQPTGVAAVLYLLIHILPMIMDLPTGRRQMFDKLSNALRNILEVAYAREKVVNGAEGGGEKNDASTTALGLLVKADRTDPTAKISPDELMAQMKEVLIAGFEPPAAALTWGLIEIARRPEIQSRLRAEIVEFSENNGGEPTWDQLTAGFPYLTAFTHEVLRCYPSLPVLRRVAAEDDILPLTHPIITADGKEITQVPIPKGAFVSIPIKCMNLAEEFWGPTAKQFDPNRWLVDFDDEVDSDEEEAHGKPQKRVKINGSVKEKRSEGKKLRAKEIQGFKHILSFGDGPRMCLGKGFALASFKATCYVLVKHFTFEFPGGPKTELDSHWSLLPRPKVKGAEGAGVPIRIRRVDD